MADDVTVESVTAWKTTVSRGPELFGHPRGLYYLAFTEAWERFSFYGMMALVVLYMVDQLLLPGHEEHVAGLAALRTALGSVTGPMSPQAFASQIFSLYTGFVYFTPLLGGALADRWIGQRNAVVIGALSMAAGHIAMALDKTFLLALLLLVGGSGFLKGNIAAQVGALYPSDEEARRTRGFIIFSTGICVGAVIGPLLCGLLAQVYGWHYGFGIAAIFMLLGLASYLYGYRYLPAKVERRGHQAHFCGLASRSCAPRGNGNYDIPVYCLLPVLQRDASVDPTACCAQRRRLRHSGPVVPIDHVVVQYPGRAASIYSGFGAGKHHTTANPMISRRSGLGHG